jgi:hypothetical protein
VRCEKKEVLCLASSKCDRAEKKKARQEQGRADSFEALVQLGKQRGYKNPAFWAAQVMRGRKR